MNTLKPCPFCGGKNVLSTELQDGLPFIAYCQCGAENEAENWNTRPIEDALQARAEKAEEMVERLIELGDVINGDKDSVWTLQTVKERWTIEVAKWKERE